MRCSALVALEARVLPAVPVPVPVRLPVANLTVLEVSAVDEDGCEGWPRADMDEACEWTQCPAEADIISIVLSRYTIHRYYAAILAQPQRKKISICFTIDTPINRYFAFDWPSLALTISDAFDYTAHSAIE